MYYLQSRYYDPNIARFINADNYPSTGQGLVGNNMFAYCNNNPVAKADQDGCAAETIWDVLSLVSSIVEVVQNPKDPWAWIGLAGDIIDVAVPFVGGVGEVVRAANTARKAIDTADGVKDAGKVVSNVTSSLRSSAVRKAWKNEVNLVKNTGFGTRAWTELEVDELLTTGKVKGYVGHHMKSVKGYPELAEIL